jgi:hypothetical protein
MGGRKFRMYSKVVWPGYTEIEPRRVAKVGRNEPCPCGSGKKYKDCHESEGSAFLQKLAREEDRQRRRELREQRKNRGVPWYKRLFGRG